MGAEASRIWRVGEVNVNMEIERKFLVRGDGWRPASTARSTSRRWRCKALATGAGRKPTPSPATRSSPGSGG